MKPVPTQGATHLFRAPKNWNAAYHGECSDLSVRVYQDGLINMHVSTWKPSEEELAILVGGGRVELTCCGQQPPVSVGVCGGEG